MIDRIDDKLRKQYIILITSVLFVSVRPSISPYISFGKFVYIYGHIGLFSVTVAFGDVLLFVRLRFLLLENNSYENFV